MKKPIPTFSNLDAGLEIELARRRAIHHVHDAARILTRQAQINIAKLPNSFHSQAAQIHLRPLRRRT